MAGIGREPLILTLKLHNRDAAYFDRLRRTHFPAERNFVAAHLTVFHHLPGEKRVETGQLIDAVAAETAPISFRVTGLRMLGRGVAFTVRSPELSKLRAALASKLDDWLTPQDRAGFSPHVTVQNKVEPATAKALYAELAAGFTPSDGVSLGLDMWTYLGGPWRHEWFFPFG